ncbi:Thioesterase superfamily protein [Sulfitobacter noctilucicola]|uniref:4-hydroxybenzoyl-CoA thioesterase n=1 Tax=Sulfitobacter noctilucicola TaxID=1342301 RepID=A0A7W6Q552_9RHOB|nr:thioesterase family protein [Sulfitobacter noctilucicola]KIN70017.1 Thioesterase superfamily protein [Sulfitobacter noctilucicola]MBB4176030.1 4-hydroxybenzoyl-CoA thioesterase [Sulfitobacter noctilucicola]
MRFVMPQKVKFKHCDPAGIVFYPRYFEMINDCVEAFFDDALNCPFETLHEDGGVPTAEISVQFTAPSRHGDHLELALICTRIGRSSLGITTEATCEGERRFLATSTLVLTDAHGKSTPWPDDLRQLIEMRIVKDAA